MNKPTHTPGNLDVFVGNANGRGLIRLEIQGTGQHIASMPRGVQSEADASRLSLCWNCHDQLLQALSDLTTIAEGDWKGIRAATPIEMKAALANAKAIIKTCRS